MLRKVTALWLLVNDINRRRTGYSQVDEVVVVEDLGQEARAVPARDGSWHLALGRP